MSVYNVKKLRLKHSTPSALQKFTTLRITPPTLIQSIHGTEYYLSEGYVSFIKLSCHD